MQAAHVDNILSHSLANMFRQQIIKPSKIPHFGQKQYLMYSSWMHQNALRWRDCVKGHVDYEYIFIQNW